jgi:hypothetical protein
MTTTKAGVGLLSVLVILLCSVFTTAKIAHAQADPAGTSGSVAALPAAPDQPADFDLGGQTILRLRASAGGMTPQQRIDAIEARLTPILSNPKIPPSSVVVYTPVGLPPVIYVMGRRFITVDAATVASAGTPDAKPLSVAIGWAKQLQQVLPRVNWRPSNMPEPVIPADPPLVVTGDLNQVGGNIGAIRLHGQVVAHLRGPQPGGMTAVERAETITARLGDAAAKVTGTDPSQVTVVPSTAPDATGSDQILVAGAPVMEVDEDQVQAAQVGDVDDLANEWADNIRHVLGLAEPPPAVAPQPTP